jgi:hypothetical protein
VISQILLVKFQKCGLLQAVLLNGTERSRDALFETLRRRAKVRIFADIRGRNSFVAKPRQNPSPIKPKSGRIQANQTESNQF